VPGDEGSHVYNAWLAQLAEEGKAPGVYVERQWQNVLVDLMLVELGKVFGLATAERIVVSVCVLVLFWGVFGLISVVSGRQPWFLCPCIAMLAYGYVFQAGFMNFYLSVGLAAAALAYLWSGKRGGTLLAAVLAPLILLAHSLGALWFLGCAVYRLVQPRLRGWAQILLPGVAVLMLAVVHLTLKYHFPFGTQWSQVPFYRRLGFDQLLTFGHPYYIPLKAVRACVAVMVVAEIFRRGFRSLYEGQRKLWLELYGLSILACVLLPENFQLGPSVAWAGLIVSRFTLITAIFGLCWLGTMAPQKWHLIAFSLCAVCFFFLSYRDTAYLDRLAANTDRITYELPYGTRVIALLYAPPDYRMSFLHIADRACVAHCFFYSNYEPSTRLFRVRAAPGSPVVVSSIEKVDSMQAGTYRIRKDDLPLKEIYQCDAKDLTQVCVRSLEEGEENGRVGYHPD
jgi:hypothetical protein